jgi:hypothetical protein
VPGRIYSKLPPFIIGFGGYKHRRITRAIGHFFANTEFIDFHGRTRANLITLGRKRRPRHQKKHQKRGK